MTRISDDVFWFAYTHHASLNVYLKGLRICRHWLTWLWTHDMRKTVWLRTNKLENKSTHKQIWLWVLSQGKTVWAYDMTMCIENPPYEHGFCFACYGGNILLAEMCRQRGKITWLERGFYLASQMGHINMVQWLLSQGARYVNWAAETACKNGHYSVFCLLADTCEINQWNDVYINCCVSGNLRLMRKCEEYVKNSKDEIHWDEAFETICENGHIHLFDYVHMRLLEYMLKLKLNIHNIHDIYDTHNRALATACRGGWWDIVYTLINLGANDYITAMRHACEGGHIDLAKNMAHRVEKQIGMSSFPLYKKKEDMHTVWNWLLWGASRYNRIDVVRFLIEKKGASALDNAFYMARTYGWSELEAYITLYLNNN